MYLFLESAAGTTAAGSSASMILMFVVLIAVFYFFLIVDGNIRDNGTSQARCLLFGGDDIHGSSFRGEVIQAFATL